MNNFHTHTYRCKHAVGTEEEYVLAAIEAGYKKLGFSDHVPLPPACQETRARMHPDELEDYVSEINRLKDKYADQIDLYISFEFDEFEFNSSFNNMIMEKYNVDYKMFGNHFYKSVTDTSYFGRNYVGKDILSEYFEMAKPVLESGKYDVMAHPDLFMNSYKVWDDRSEMMSRKLCELALKHNIILEYNVSGIQKGLPCPHDKFWEVVKEVGNTVIVGVDAHDPDDLLQVHHAEAINRLKDEKFNVIDDLV